jgi:transcriptional regulator with GAF, ATPase, and Fis domain
LLQNIRAASFIAAQKLIINWARALQGLTDHPLSLSDADFQERDYQEAHKTDAFFLTFFHIIRLHLHVTFAEYDKALVIAREAQKVVHALEGTIWPVLLDFLHGLTLAALAPTTTESERSSFFSDIDTRRVSLARLAAHCPENFRGWALLLDAESARISGDPSTAMTRYEEAIRYAQETRSPINEALAYELCGRFWRERGNDAIAALYLGNAQRCYKNWNATAKVRELEKRYLDLLEKQEAHKEQSPGQSAPEMLAISGAQRLASLDFATVAKAAHAIAGEMELADLLRALMRIAIENVGAQRGLFLRDHNGQLTLEAEGGVDRAEVSVFQHTPLEQYTLIARAVVQYVHKTHENVIVGDATTDQRFANDSYIQTLRPCSILCTPIVHQGRFEGVLYLENNLTADVFTAERVRVMEVLSSQAAISLENARLYEEMKQEVNRRRQAEETPRTIVEGTPCKRVYAGEICQYAENIQKLFPEDADLVELGAESYIGIPMHDASGGVIGHLVVLDTKPLGDASQWLPILRIFAARAGAELERQRAEENLRTALSEVEELKNRLHAENIYLQEEIRQEHNFEEIVGNSPALLNVLRKVELVAPTDATVLIVGETGTGKELIARAIHDRSTRKDRPLVKMNCGAISAGLVESELFGHVKGAFTGAHERRTGRFELANGGTLFLFAARPLRISPSRGDFHNMNHTEPTGRDSHATADRGKPHTEDDGGTAFNLRGWLCRLSSAVTGSVRGTVCRCGWGSIASYLVSSWGRVHWQLGISQGIAAQ